MKANELFAQFLVRGGSAASPSLAPAAVVKVDAVLMPGQELRGEVLSARGSGRYMVNVGQSQVEMALPQSFRPGDKLNLVYLGNERMPTFLLQQTPTQMRPAGEGTELSGNARMLGELRASGQSGTVEGQVVADKSAMGSGQTLGQALARAVDQSGLFYERHLASWVQGQVPLKKILQEPQGQFSPRLQEDAHKEGTAATASQAGKAVQQGGGSTASTSQGTVASARSAGGAQAVAINNGAGQAISASPASSTASTARALGAEAVAITRTPGANVRPAAERVTDASSEIVTRQAVPAAKPLATEAVRERAEVSTAGSKVTGTTTPLPERSAAGTPKQMAEGGSKAPLTDMAARSTAIGQGSVDVASGEEAAKTGRTSQVARVLSPEQTSARTFQVQPFHLDAKAGSPPAPLPESARAVSAAETMGRDAGKAPEAFARAQPTPGAPAKEGGEALSPSQPRQSVLAAQVPTPQTVLAAKTGGAGPTLSETTGSERGSPPPGSSAPRASASAAASSPTMNLSQEVVGSEEPGGPQGAKAQVAARAALDASGAVIGKEGKGVPFSSSQPQPSAAMGPVASSKHDGVVEEAAIPTQAMSPQILTSPSMGKSGGENSQAFVSIFGRGTITVASGAEQNKATMEGTVAKQAPMPENGSLPGKDVGKNEASMMDKAAARMVGQGAERFTGQAQERPFSLGTESKTGATFAVGQGSVARSQDAEASATAKESMPSPSQPLKGELTGKAESVALKTDASVASKTDGGVSLSRPNVEAERGGGAAQMRPPMGTLTERGEGLHGEEPRLSSVRTAQTGMTGDGDEGAAKSLGEGPEKAGKPESGGAREEAARMQAQSARSGASTHSGALKSMQAMEAYQAMSQETSAGAPLGRGAEAVPQNLQNLVQAQLQALEQNKIHWSGQLWPGQNMEWTIEERPARGEEWSTWSTRVRLNLVKLGPVDASLQMISNRLWVRIIAPESASSLHASQQDLQAAFEDAGLDLRSLSIGREAKER